MIYQPADKFPVHLIMFLGTGERYSATYNRPDNIHQPRQPAWNIKYTIIYIYTPTGLKHKIHNNIYKYKLHKQTLISQYKTIYQHPPR